MNRDQIVERIAECERVTLGISDSPVWAVVTKDLSEQKQLIDDHWQDISDEVKLRRARELKHACSYVLGLKDRYEEELLSRKRELHLMDNPDLEIAKDYDNETEYEDDGRR